MGAYRSLLSQRSVTAIALAALLTRVPNSVLGLGLLLVVQASHDSYAAAGTVVTGYAIAYAVGIPLTARWVERSGPARVMPLCLLVYLGSGAFLLVALATDRSVVLLVAAAALLGASTPPAGPLIRGSWALVVAAGQLRSVFAFDAAINSAALLGGPLMVTLMVTLASPGYAIVVGGLSMSLGVLLIMFNPELRRKKADRTASRSDWLGPLANRNVRTLLTVVVFDTIAYGALMVGISASATSRNLGQASGVLISVYSAAIIGGGLVYGGGKWGAREHRQLSLFLGVGAAMLAAAALAPGLVVLGLLLVMFGSVGGPRDILVQLMLGGAAAEHQRTEAFAWLSTVMWTSFGIGTSVGGQLVRHGNGDGNLSLALAALTTALGGIWALRIRSS